MKRSAAVLLALLPLYLPGWSPAFAQAVLAPAPPPSAPQALAPEQAQATPLRIVVVHWKIKHGREAEFLDYWATRSVVEDRSGLIAEFLSSVADRDRFPWINWQNLNPDYTSYFNVGVWRDAADFQSQIGRFINNSRPPLDFEAERRERVFLAPERWRVGRSDLPNADPPGVK